MEIKNWMNEWIVQNSFHCHESAALKAHAQMCVAHNTKYLL